MIDPELAKDFTQDWIEAWNTHDIERILAHYDDTIEMVSPLIVERLGKTDGQLRGKAAVRKYWLPSLVQDPPLVFELLGVFAGVDSVTIHYHNRGRRVVAETLFLNDSLKVTRGVVHWSVMRPQE